MRVSGPDGRQWQVRRRWLTFRRPRWRGDRDADRGVEALDFVDLADDLVGVVIGIVVAVLVVLILSGLVLPLVLFLGEVLLILPLALLGVVGRVLLRRPWTVQASCGSRVVRTHASGWAASRLEIARLADEIRRGALG